MPMTRAERQARWRAKKRRMGNRAEAVHLDRSQTAMCDAVAWWQCLQFKHDPVDNQATSLHKTVGRPRALRYLVSMMSTVPDGTLEFMGNIEDWSLGIPRKWLLERRNYFLTATLDDDIFPMLGWELAPWTEAEKNEPDVFEQRQKAMIRQVTGGFWKRETSWRRCCVEEHQVDLWNRKPWARQPTAPWILDDAFVKLVRGGVAEGVGPEAHETTQRLIDLEEALIKAGVN